MGSEENCLYHEAHNTKIERNTSDIGELKTVINKLDVSIDNLQQNLNKLVVKFALVNGAILGVVQVVPIVLKFIK